MAAPKTAGRFFGGTSGGAETPASRSSGSWLKRFSESQTKQSPCLSPGAACLSLAVPERTRRTQEIDLRYQQASDIVSGSDAVDSLRACMQGLQSRHNTA